TPRSGSPLTLCSPGEEHLPDPIRVGGVGQGVFVLLERVCRGDGDAQRALADEGGQAGVDGDELVTRSRVEPVLLPKTAEAEVAEDQVTRPDDDRGTTHSPVAD